LDQKRKIIRNGLQKYKNIILVQKSVREEILQGILSLGDHRVGLAILDHLKTGFPWKQVLQRDNIDLKKLLFQKRSYSSSLPWDFIKTDLSKESLWKWYQKYHS
jgi:hypothetical protein